MNPTMWFAIRLLAGSGLGVPVVLLVGVYWLASASRRKQSQETEATQPGPGSGPPVAPVVAVPPELVGIGAPSDLETEEAADLPTPGGPTAPTAPEFRGIPSERASSPGAGALPLESTAPAEPRTGEPVSRRGREAASGPPVAPVVAVPPELVGIEAPSDLETEEAADLPAPGGPTAPTAPEFRGIPSERASSPAAGALPLESTAPAEPPTGEPVSLRNAPARPPAHLAAGESGAIRAWARSNGYVLSNRGRIPQNLVDAYRQSQKKAADPQAKKGRPKPAH